MRQLRIYFTLMLMSVLGSAAVAQMVSPVDFMRNNPRAAFANPATFVADYGYFDMGLGGINIGVMNLGLKYDKFFRFNSQGQPVVVDLDQGVASLRRKNYVNSYVNADIFHCGRRTKHGYFTYTHRIREKESMSYTRDLLQLLAKGNAAFVGESNPANIDVRVSAKAFQEFAFGYQMSLTEQLNVGLRLKFLMGYMDAKSKTINAKLYTDPDTYTLKLMTAADARGTLPYELYKEDGKIKIKDGRFNVANLFKNYGLGIDLGGEYRIDDEFGVAAAINDLGFIKWNNYSVRFKGELTDGGSYYDNGAFVFTGVTPQQVLGIMQDPEYLPKLADSLTKYFQLNPETLTKYTSGLNANLMVRGYYDYTPEHRFSAQLMGYNLGLGLRPALTLAYTGSFDEKYDVVATYTMMPGSYDNLGVGLSANLGGMLVYVATNNLFGFFNPANRTFLNAQFGISFMSGENISRSETIILRDQAAEAEADMED